MERPDRLIYLSSSMLRGGRADLAGVDWSGGRESRSYSDSRLFVTQHSGMDAKLFAWLSYSDAPAALNGLQAVGFDVIHRQDGPGGTVLHAEIRMGEAVLMVASNDAAYQRPPLIGRSTGQGLYLLIEDVDAFHQKALAAGGTSVIEPEDTEWGTRRSRVLDPQGQEWSAGTYEPGTDP